MNTRARYEAALNRARQLRSEIDQLQRQGKGPNDPEMSRKNAEWASALDEADALKVQLRNEERATVTVGGSEQVAEGVRQVRYSGGNRERQVFDAPSTWERFAASERGNRSDPTGSREYDQAFMEYIASGGAYLPRHMVETNRELQALWTGSDADGGFVVPVDRRTDILGAIPAFSEFLNVVTLVPAQSGEVEWVRVQPNADSPDIYTSAFVGSMVGEGVGGGAAAPKFGLFSIRLKHARAQANFSRTIAEDYERLSTFLNADGAANLALVAENEALTGSGIGNHLLGVMNFAANAEGSQGVDEVGMTDVSGTTADQISNTTADNGSADALFDLFYSVPAQYRRRDSFRTVFNSDTEKKIRKLVDANARYYWSADGGFGSPANGSFIDRPYAVSEFMPSGGTDGNRVILTGDMAQIMFAARGVITAQVLTERYSDVDQIAIVLRWRFGVSIANPRAVRFGRV